MTDTRPTPTPRPPEQCPEHGTPGRQCWVCDHQARTADTQEQQT